MAEQQKPLRPDADIELDSDYANNVFFEPSIWDLKLIFGEFSGRSNDVDWHTSITLPWAQAKLLHYYLGLNIAIHELANGSPIEIPAQMLPTLPQLPEAEESDPLKRAVHDFAESNRNRFIQNLKKVPSV
jgi:hypothetical protein